jgi:protein gp37
MSLESSGISWTDGTLNSLYGCSACSVGCRLCYAVNRVYRHSWNLKLNRDERFHGLVMDGRFTGEVLFDPEHLYAVLKDRKPKMIFVNEFSDLLHDALPMKVLLEHVRVFKAACLRRLTGHQQTLLRYGPSIVWTDSFSTRLVCRSGR